MYKLFATDLDGTLLDDFGMLPEVNKEYIQKITDSGVLVALCSGRSHESLAWFEKQLSLDKPGCYGISFNGGIVYNAHSGEILSDIRMKRELALELADDIKLAACGMDIGLGVYAGTNLYAEQSIEAVSGYANKSGIKVTKLDSFSEIKQDVTKLLVKGENAQLEVLNKKMLASVRGRCQMYFTASDLLEFIPQESGKGRGLCILAEKLGIDISETIAVGDQVNDVDMIKAAGLGVAVANAVDRVKAAAGYITRADNNAGVMKEIAQKFLSVY
jgi:Cof subfamily protein (haloacid dehalogenase superfamily)